MNWQFWRRYDIWLILLAAWAVFWWPVVSGQAQFYSRDLTFYAFPMKAFMLERFHAGAFPFWNPSLSTGMPYLAEPSHQALYPFNLIFLLIPSVVQGISWFVLLHSLFGMAAMAYLGFTLGLNRYQSLWMALVYGFSGYVLGITDNVNYLPATVWAPLGLATFIRGFQFSNRQYLQYSGLTALSVAMMILAGDSLNPMFLGVFCSLYWAYRTWIDRAVLSPKCSALHLVLSFGLGGALCLAQLLPTWELLQVSVRQEALRYEEVTLWALPPERLLEFFIPYLFGSKFPSPHFIGQFLYPDFHETWVDSIYIGLIPLLLAGLALRYQFKRHAYWLLLVILSLIFAFGDNMPYYRLIYQFFPPIQVQRYLEKFVFWSSLGLIILAGLGLPVLKQACTELTQWLSKKSRLTPLGFTLGILFGGSFLFILLPAQFWIFPHAMERSGDWGAHFYERPQHVFGLFGHWLVMSGLVVALFWLNTITLRQYSRWLLVIAILDLWLMHWQDVPLMPSELLVNRPTPLALQDIQALKQQLRLPEHLRVYYDDVTGFVEREQQPDIFERLQHAYHLPYLSDNFGVLYPYRVLYNQERLLFNYGIAYGIHYQNGRYAPLQPKNHKRMDVAVAEIDLPYLMQLNSINLIITPVSPENPKWRRQGFSEVASRPDFNLKLIHVENTLPRAYIAPNAVYTNESVFHGGATETYQIMSDAFRARPLGQTVELSTAGKPSPPQTSQPSSVRWLKDTPEDLKLWVSSPYPTSHLVVTEAYFPGWSAVLDPETPHARPLPIIPANHRFMAIPLPSGRHTVTLSYRSTYFGLGLMGSLVSLLAVGLLWGYANTARKSA